MSVNGYLLNSNARASDAEELKALRTRPGHLDAVVAEGSNRLLVPWFLCFRPGDVRGIDAASGPLPRPCTTVAQATRNLEGSLPVFEAIAGDAALAEAYWSLACKLVRRLPLPYLSLELSEVLESGGDTPEHAARQVMGALSGDLTAVPFIKSLVEYRDGVAPYPPDVLYAIGGGIDVYGDRTWNSTVLDGGFQPDFKYVAWNKAGDTPEPQAPPLLPDSDFGELRGVKERIAGWAKAVVPSANAWATLVPGSPEGVAVYVYARSEADTARLQSSEDLRSRLDPLERELFGPWCRKHGFDWKGFHMSPPPRPARR